MGGIKVKVMGVAKRLKKWKWKLKWSDAEKERNLAVKSDMKSQPAVSSVQDECACTCTCRAQKRRD